MKKIFSKSIAVFTIFLFLLTLSLPSVAKENITISEDDSYNSSVNFMNVNEQDVDVNDLVFRGTGMELLPDSTISVDLQWIDSLYAEVLSIVICDYKKNEIVKTMDMDYGNIFYIVEQNGMYAVLALVKDNDGAENWINITSKATISSEQECTPIEGDSLDLLPLPLVSEQTENECNINDNQIQYYD